MGEQRLGRRSFAALECRQELGVQPGELLKFRGCGKRLIADKGCGLCHTVPGVPRADGLVGPGLARVGSRVYLAGVIANSPGNMVRWLLDPLLSARM